MFEIYDTLSKQTFSKEDTGQYIASEMKFTTPSKGFLIDMHGKVWLHFHGGTTVCLTCHHPGRFVIIPEGSSTKAYLQNTIEACEKIRKSVMEEYGITDVMNNRPDAIITVKRP